MNQPLPQKKHGKPNKITSIISQLRLPLAVKIIYIISALCIPLSIIFMLSQSFSDFFNRNISTILRGTLAYATSWIPFSLAEFLLLMIPVLVFVITKLVLKKFGESTSELVSAMISVLSILAFIFSAFTIGFSPAYRGTTLDKKLGIKAEEVSAEQLYDTALVLIEKINDSVDEIYYGENGFSVMPYGYEEMNVKLLDAFDSISDKHAFMPRLDSRIKPVMLSEAMSYTHITGVYTFFTGEANLNVAFPDYTLPFTAAHELSHQRGVARENEANFMAFLVCAESDDSYIRYCAYLNLYEYVANALYRANSELYMKAWTKLPICVKDELSAYSSFIDKYRDSTVSEISNAVNDTFLKFQGTEGTRSYGMVVDLAVAYFAPKQEN